MPLILSSTYQRAPLGHINGHLQTIIPSFRKVEGFDYHRERHTLADGDFVDLDWLEQGNNQLLILSHGLEGSSNRPYIRSAAKYFHQRGWDVLAWNCRSCSGEMNKHFRLYNHGEIEDLGEVVQHALARRKYEKVALLGFSMGGSITMKYLGVNADHLPPEIQRAVAFSIPCDLTESIRVLDKPANYLYRRKFIRSLRRKITIKAGQFPGKIDLNNFNRIKVWRDFDNFFSAPMSGYENAEDFYQKGSAVNYLEKINIPVLICNAQNDPILTPLCSPRTIAEHHHCVFLETPKTGGHVGFALPREKEYSWMDLRAYEFIVNGK